MRFEALTVEGAFLIHLDAHRDERGYFARTFSAEEFARAGLDPTVAQCNVSVNPRRGTLRGLHYQASPFSEAKLIRCTRGALFDVGADVRADSPSFRNVTTVELREGDLQMLFLPAGVAHGFLTLENDTEVTYQMSHVYVPGSERGVRWDDPAFEIAWPGQVEVISERDRSFPDFQS